ncbi:MAG TPA: capsular biosynthesis protein, partial [Ferruginibacter sp.]|nr:capsular biosynthesis protein [Ferruginibacter sp.]
ETPVKAKGVAILDKLFEVYNAAGIREKNQMAINTINFIEDRLATVIRQLDSVENKIKDYKARYGITDLGAQASLYFNKVNELDKMKGEVELRMD